MRLAQRPPPRPRLQDRGRLPARPHGALARKYCGGGWGGYALYIFGGEDARAEFLAVVQETHAIEPFLGHVH